MAGQVRATQPLVPSAPLPQQLPRARTDEPKAFADHSANEAFLATVVESVASSIHAAAQGRIRNDASLPDRLNQIVFADDSVAILNKVCQQVEDLRFDRKRFTAATEFAATAVKHKILEKIQQPSRSRSQCKLAARIVAAS